MRNLILFLFVSLYLSICSNPTEPSEIVHLSLNDGFSHIEIDGYQRSSGAYDIKHDYLSRWIEWKADYEKDSGGKIVTARFHSVERQFSVLQSFKVYIFNETFSWP